MARNFDLEIAQIDLVLADLARDRACRFLARITEEWKQGNIPEKVYEEAQYEAERLDLERRKAKLAVEKLEIPT